MAYNPAIYQTYGNGLYGQNMGQTVSQPPVTPQTNAQQEYMGIIWVDGEIDAKAKQIPGWWPVGKPLPMWDTNDTVIYLKSINQFGMPNPMQKIRYQMEELRGMHPEQARLESGSTEPKPDMSEYVRKEDLEQVKDELMRTIQESTAPVTTRRTGTKGEN